MSEDNLEQRELSDGDYVELPKWLSHGQMKAVQRIIVQSRKNDQEMDIQTDLIQMLVKNWSLKDGDGGTLPINKAGIEKAPQTKINEVFGEISRLIELTTPNS